MANSNEKIRKSDRVEWGDQTCRVLKRRRVSGLAMFQTCDHEICLESLKGDFIGWVGENEVTKIDGEASDS